MMRIWPFRERVTKSYLRRLFESHRLAEHVYVLEHKKHTMYPDDFEQAIRDRRTFLDYYNKMRAFEAARDKYIEG